MLPRLESANLMYSVTMPGLHAVLLLTLYREKTIDELLPETVPEVVENDRQTEGKI